MTEQGAEGHPSLGSHLSGSVPFPTKVILLLIWGRGGGAADKKILAHFIYISTVYKHIYCLAGVMGEEGNNAKTVGKHCDSRDTAEQGLASAPPAPVSLLQGAPPKCQNLGVSTCFPRQTSFGNPAVPGSSGI